MKATKAPNQVPGPFVLSKLETQAVQYVKDHYADIWLNVVLAALDRAVRTLAAPEPVPGPFVLSSLEREALELVLKRADPHALSTQRVRELVGRAVRALGAPAVEPLSEVDEKDVANFELLLDSREAPPDSVERAVQRIIRKRFPKPAPVQRTPEDLGSAILQRLDIMQYGDLLAAVQELVRRAK